MMTLIKQQADGSDVLSFPKKKTLNKYMIPRSCVDSKSSSYPVFDIVRWNIDHNLKNVRLSHKSKDSKRLHTALTLFGNLDLMDCTLLDPATRKKHGKNLYRRMLRLIGKNLLTVESVKSNFEKFDKFGASKNIYFESLDHQEARPLIRFITVVHAVESLDVDIALERAFELKNEIQKYVSKVAGAACIGTIEIEVTSIKQGRRLRDFDSATARDVTLNIDDDGEITFGENNKTYRKLEDCEVLASHLSSDHINGESGQFIIHFHGVLKVEKHDNLKELNRIFLTNPNWNRAKRQVLFKPFSELWDGKHKTLEKSLKDIAFYITKGGKVKRGASSYLQYNLKMPIFMPMAYDEFLNFSDRCNDSKRQELINKGYILDLPILSHHEINSLALVVHGMMKWNKSGTGYVISVGKW